MSKKYTNTGGSGAQGQAYTTPTKKKGESGAQGQAYTAPTKKKGESGAQGQAYTGSVPNSVSSPTQKGVYVDPDKTIVSAYKNAQNANYRLIQKNPWMSKLTPLEYLTKYYNNLSESRKNELLEKLNTVAVTVPELPSILQEYNSLTEDLTPAEFISKKYQDLTLTQRQDLIDDLSELEEPKNAEDWYLITAADRQQRENDYQQNLLFLGLLQMQQNLEVVKPLAARELYRSSTALQKYQQKAFEHLQNVTDAQLEARQKAYEEWYTTTKFSEGTTIDDVLGPLSWKWLREYNDRYGLDLPILYDQVYAAMGIEHTTNDYTEYLTKKFNEQYKDKIEATNTTNNEKYKQTLENVASQFPEDIELKLNGAQLEAAQRIVSEYDNANQINDPIDVIINLETRGKIGGLPTWINQVHSATSSEMVRMAVRQIYDYIRSDKPIYIWNQDQYLDEFKKELGVSDFKDATDEDWYRVIFKYLEQNYNITPDTALQIIQQTNIDWAYPWKEAGKELTSLAIDKFWDPLVLGRVDIVLGNLLTSVGQTTDITTYPIKYLVSQANPTAFGSYRLETGGAQSQANTAQENTAREDASDVMQVAVSATFSKTGRINPNYDTGNWVVDLILETISDITFLLNMGASIGTKVVGTKLSSTITQEAVEKMTFLSKNKKAQQELIEYLSKSAFNPGKLKKVAGSIFPYVDTPKGAFAKQLANGKDVKEAIETILKRTDLPQEVQKLVRAGFTDDIINAFVDVGKHDLSLNIIKGLKTADMIADSIDSTLLKLSLISAGPGLPFIVLKKGIPAITSVARARYLRIQQKYTNAETGLINLKDFVDYAEDFIADRKTKVTDKTTNTSSVLLKNLYDSVIYDVRQFTKIKNSFELGNAELADVYKQLQEFIIEKFPDLAGILKGEIDIEKGLTVLDKKCTKKLFAAYRQEVLNKLDELIELGIAPESIASMKAVLDEEFSNFQMLMQSYESVYSATKYIHQEVLARVNSLEDQITDLSKIKKTLTTGLRNVTPEMETLSKKISDALALYFDKSIDITERTDLLGEIIVLLRQNLGATKITFSNSLTKSTTIISLEQALNLFREVPIWLKTELPNFAIKDLEEINLPEINQLLQDITGSNFAKFTNATQQILEQSGKTLDSISTKEFSILINKQLDEMFSQISQDLIDSFTRPINEAVQNIKTTLEIRLQNLSKKLNFFQVIPENKLSLEKLWKDKVKNVPAYKTLTNIQKRQVSNEILNAVTSKLLHNMRQTDVVSHNATKQVKSLKKTLTGLFDDFNKTTQTVLSASEQKNFFERLQELGTDYTKINPDAKDFTTTLSFSTEKFIANFEEFLKQLDSIKQGTLYYTDLIDNRNFLIKQISDLQDLEKEIVKNKAQYSELYFNQLNTFDAFLAQTSSVLKGSQLENTIKQTKNMAFNDAYYRLQTEKFFCHRLLNFDTGWADLSADLLGEPIGEVSTKVNSLRDLLQRLQQPVENFEFLDTATKAKYTKASELAAEIKHYAVVTQLTKDMQNEILTAFDKISPFKLYNSEFKNTEIINALLSTMQKIDIPLKELSQKIPETVERVAEQTMLLLNTSQKIPEMSLDSFRNNIDFKTWFKNSRFAKYEDIAFKEAHSSPADTLLTAALFEYLCDNSVHKNIPNLLKLETPVDFKHTWVWDLETSGKQYQTNSVLTISCRNLKDPDLSFYITVKNPQKKPYAALTQKLFGSQENYIKLLETAEAETETEAMQKMYAFIKQNSDVPMDQVHLLAHNGDKFDSRFGTKLLPDHSTFFDPSNNLDTLKMLRKMYDYFELTEDMKNNLTHIFQDYVTKQLNTKTISSLEPRFIMGADKGLADKINEFVKLFDNNLTSQIPELKAYQNFLSELKTVSSNISARLKGIKTDNRVMFSSYLSRAELKEAGTNIVAELFDPAGINMLGSKKFYDTNNVTPFFEGLEKEAASPQELLFLGKISEYANQTAENIVANTTFKNFDFDSVIAAIKEQGSKKSDLNYFIQHLYNKNTAEYNYAIIRQLTYWDDTLKEVIPTELLLALENPKLFSSNLPTEYFDKIMKNIGQPQDLIDSFTELRQSDDILEGFNSVIDKKNKYWNNPEMRIHGLAIKESRKLSNMATELAINDKNFIAKDIKLHDIMMSAYLKQFFQLPLENGKITEVGLNKLISHMLYNSGTPIIRIAVKDLPIEEEFNTFIKLLKQNSDLLEAKGIKLIQDDFASYLVLTDNIGTDLTQDFSRLTYKGTTIKRPWELTDGKNFFDEFDLSSSEIPGIEEYTKQLNIVNEQIRNGTLHDYFQKIYVGPEKTGKWFQMSQGTGAIKELINTSELEDIFNNYLPQQVKDSLMDPTKFLSDNVHTGITFNHFNLGSFESRKEIQPLLSPYYSKRLSNTVKRMTEYGEAKYQMLNIFTETDASLHLGQNGELSTAFKRMFNVTGEPTKDVLQDVQQYLRQHPEFTLAAVVQDQKHGFKLIQIRPNSIKEIQEAIRLDSIIVENNVFSYLYNKINYNQIGEKAPLLARIAQKSWMSYMIVMKLGWLTRTSTYLNNIFDNMFKFMTDTKTGPVTMGTYQLSAMMEYIHYNKVMQEIQKSGLDNIEEAITDYFRTAKKIPFSEARFKELRELFHSDMFSGSSWAEQSKYIKEAGNLSKADKIFQNLLTIGFMPIAFPETVARLAHYNYLQDIGIGINKSMQRIIGIYFDYSQAKHGILDFLFPFYNFMTNNLTFWMKTLDTNPQFFKTVFRLAPYIMDESNMTAVQMLDEPQRNMQKNLLHLPLSMFTDGAFSGSYLSLNFSFMEMMRLFANPIQYFEDNLFTFPQQAIYTAQYAAEHPDLLQGSSLAAIWNAAQDTYSGYSYVLGERPATIPDEDTVAVQTQLIDNFKQLIPIYGSLTTTYNKVETIKRRTGQFFIPSLLNVPYHAHIVDVFSDAGLFRTYEYLNNNNQIIYKEQLPLEPNYYESGGAQSQANSNNINTALKNSVLISGPSLKDQSNTKTTYDPTKKIKITKYDDKTVYELIDRRTNQTLYTAIYPVNKNAKLVNTDNADGSRTSSLVALDGTVLWSRTTTASTNYLDYGTKQTIRNKETGDLVGIYMYTPKSTYTHEEIDASGLRTLKRYGPKGELLGTTRIRETAEGTAYYYFDSNGIFQSMNFYKSEDLHFEEKSLGQNKYALIAYDKSDNVQFIQYYIKKTVDIAGTTMSVKEFYNIDFQETYYQYQYYNSETDERITYSQGYGQLKNGATAKKVEKYNEKTGTIIIQYYNKFGDIYKTEEKKAEFNYLNYQPGSYTKLFKYSFYDPQTKITLTQYKDSSGKLYYYRKIINTSNGKIYEYYNAQNELTSRTIYSNNNNSYYSSETGNYQEVKSFDIANNIKISSYYDSNNNLVYVRKIIPDFNPNHLGKTYEYYDANGNLTSSQFYSSLTQVYETQTLGEQTYTDSMNTAEYLEYTYSILLQKKEALLKLAETGENLEYLEDDDTLEQLNAQLTSISAELGKFTTQQKNTSSNGTGLKQSGYNSTSRQYSRIQSVANQPNKASLMVSRIRGYTTSKSPFSIYTPKDMNGIYFSQPNFYQKLYTQQGAARLIQNVNIVLQRSQRQHTVQKLTWQR